MASSNAALLFISSFVLLQAVSSQMEYQCTMELTRHPNYDNCNKYYMCQNGKLYINTCSNGQRFDSLSRECVESSRAVCAQRQPTPEPPTAPPGFKCSSVHGDFPHGHLCERFYRCSEWTWTDMACPRGMLFDQRTMHCVEETMVECGRRVRPDGASTLGPEEPGTEEEEEERLTTVPPRFMCPVQNGLFPHGENCQQYYDCYNWLPYERTCPRGTLFDVRSGECGPEAGTDCGARRRPDGASPVEPEVTTPLADTTGQPTTEREDGAGGEVECPSPNGSFPHPRDRQKFIVCVSGNLYLMHCPANLVYHPVSKVCVWP